MYVFMRTVADSSGACAKIPRINSNHLHRITIRRRKQWSKSPFLVVPKKRLELSHCFFLLAWEVRLDCPGITAFFRRGDAIRKVYNSDLSSN